MRPGPLLRRDFFDRPCLEVAGDLVGVWLIRSLPDGTRVGGPLVEVEAYLGDGSDPGSHAHRGPTPRNRSMFGPPGRIYAYRSYGIHTCINLVCEPVGRAAGILLRALVPTLGIEAMRTRRGIRGAQSDRKIAAGPGRLAEALGLSLDDDGASALSGAIILRARGPGSPELRVVRSRRVGLSGGASLPYRFFAQGSPWVSPWRPAKKRREGP